MDTEGTKGRHAFGGPGIVPEPSEGQRSGWVASVGEKWGGSPNAKTAPHPAKGERRLALRQTEAGYSARHGKAFENRDQT